jgi:hypothetical protein
LTLRGLAKLFSASVHLMETVSKNLNKKIINVFHFYEINPCENKLSSERSWWKFLRKDEQEEEKKKKKNKDHLQTWRR